MVTRRSHNRYARIYDSAPQPTKEQVRPTEPVFGARGEQAVTVCWWCKATVKVTFATPQVAASVNVIHGRGVVKVGDALVGNHRPGGGRVYLTRGDVPCRGVWDRLDESAIERLT